MRSIRHVTSRLKSRGWTGNRRIPLAKRSIRRQRGRLRLSMTLPLRISVLDQSPVPEGSSGPEALANTIDLARVADSLGYERYWVAEHHATPMLACASPEVVIAAIAAETSSIRVGSGGV